MTIQKKQKKQKQKQNDSLNSTKNKKEHYDLVFCTPGQKLPDTFSNLWLGIAKMGLKGAHIKLHYNANVYFTRNQHLGNNALDSDIHRPLFNNQFTYDKIVWIDHDITMSMPQLRRLLMQDKDIVAGIYHMRCREKFAVVERQDNSYYSKYGDYQFLSNMDISLYHNNIMGNNEPELEPDKNTFVDQNNYNIKHFLLPVFYSGMGAMIVKKGVFEKIGYPYFRPEFITLQNGVQEFCSEDVSFCINAKKCGFQVYVDLGVIVGHEKSYII